MANKKFLGFKQVLESTYTGLTANDKVGYIWFVRPDNVTGANTTVGDIYVGTRQYGSVDKVTWGKITTALDYFISGETVDVKTYIDEAVAGKNVSAQGETGDTALITASASGNEVTVASTQKLQEAVSAAEGALQSVSHGTDGDYVSLSVGAEDSNHNQELSVSATIVDITAATASNMGLAEAYDVKNYVDTTKSDLIGDMTGQTQTLGALEDRIDNLESESVVTVEKLDNPSSTAYTASYVVKQNGQAVGVPIDIPKDYLVKSATLEECTVADEPVSGLVPGDKYIDFVVNSVEGTGQESHIYLPVKDLVDVYTAGDGLTESNNEFSVVIDPNNANGLSVSSSGVAMAVVASGANATNGAMSVADKTKLDTIAEGAQVNVLEGVQVNGTDLTIDANKKVNVVLPTATVSGESNGVEVTVAQVSGEVTSVTVSAPDFAEIYATIDDLNDEISARTEADEILDGRLDALEAISADTQSALQSISNGQDGDYVTTTIGAKANNDQTVGVAVAVTGVADASAVGEGLADAYDVKDYVLDTIDALDGSVGPETDKYVASVDEVNGVISGTTAYVDQAHLANYSNTGETPFLSTGDTISGALSKVDDQLQVLAAGGLTRVNNGNGISVTEPSGNTQTVSINAWAETAGNETAGRAEIKFDNGAAYVEVIDISGDDVEGGA